MASIVYKPALEVEHHQRSIVAFGIVLDHFHLERQSKAATQHS
jgi:hypothetical protein